MEKKLAVQSFYKKEAQSSQNEEGVQRLTSLGYSKDEVESLPKGVVLGLSCGNPLDYARIKPGETVLDLGSGTGGDCFLASQATGESGHVIGVDFLPEMIQRARDSLRAHNNIEFRLGAIEDLPIAKDSIDCIISNCVINLSDEKERVYQECFRVLKPGGRMVLSDIIRYEELPKEIKESSEAHCN